MVAIPGFGKGGGAAAVLVLALWARWWCCCFFCWWGRDGWKLDFFGGFGGLLVLGFFGFFGGCGCGCFLGFFGCQFGFFLFSSSCMASCALSFSGCFPFGFLLGFEFGRFLFLLPTRRFCGGLLGFLLFLGLTHSGCMVVFEYAPVSFASLKVYSMAVVTVGARTRMAALTDVASAMPTTTTLFCCGGVCR